MKITTTDIRMRLQTSLHRSAIWIVMIMIMLHKNIYRWMLAWSGKQKVGWPKPSHCSMSNQSSSQINSKLTIQLQTIHSNGLPIANCQLSCSRKKEKKFCNGFGSSSRGQSTKFHSEYIFNNFHITNCISFSFSFFPFIFPDTWIVSCKLARVLQQRKIEQIQFSIALFCSDEANSWSMLEMLERILEEYGRNSVNF